MIMAAYNSSSTEVFLTWQPPRPETLNGKLRSYLVQIMEIKLLPTSAPTRGASKVLPSVAPSPSSSSTRVTIPPSGEPHLSTTDVGLNLSYHIGQLKKWTSYEVKVRAVTIAPGPFSEAVMVRTDEDGECIVF